MLIPYTFFDLADILGVHAPSVDEVIGLRGAGNYQLFDANGDLKAGGFFKNLITDVGDEYYAERAAGIASPPDQVTGMKLGTGTTAAAKVGTGASLVTYPTGITAWSALDATYPQSSQPGGAGTARVITWRASWAAGEATNAALAEVVLTNQTAIADNAGSAAVVISRALLSPTINKGALDTLTVTWTHSLFGA
jgi:hypothetical protein